MDIEHILPSSRDPNHINGPDLKPQPLLIIPPLPHSTQSHTNNNLLVPDIPHFMLQDHFSHFHSHHFLDSMWDSVNSPQSTLSSKFGSIQGSSECSSQEPSPNSHDFCWDSTFHMVEMLEKMKLEETASSRYHPHYGLQRLQTSNFGVCSPLQEQIQSIQLPQKQKLTAHIGKNYGQISQQFRKKGKGVFDVEFDNRRTRTRPPCNTHSHQQTGSRGTSCGTGVFLPRGGTSAPSESRKRSGKGCSTVLIPARVVQALLLHFEQMTAMSGLKTGGFPPLHDVLVSNKDGMYSLQKRQSRNKPAHIQNEMILPQEWTY